MKKILHWMLIAILCVAVLSFPLLLLMGTKFDNLWLAALLPACLLGAIILLWPTLWRGKRHEALKWPRWILAAVLIAAAFLLPVMRASVSIVLPEARSR
jgi:hypothetical protein